MKLRKIAGLMALVLLAQCAAPMRAYATTDGMPDVTPEVIMTEPSMGG